MISARHSSKVIRSLLGGAALCMILSLPAFAQVQTEKSVSAGEATKQVKIDRGEVVYVSGNDVVIKMQDGTLRHFNNVPDSVTVNVDGQQLNVHQLKPGMKVERQTITTTTPKTVTTVQTVTGTVWNVIPPNSVTLTMDNGKNQTFKIPQGQKFMVDGRETDAFGLRKGMKISAQKVTEVPETVVTQEVKRTGTMPPPPPAPTPDVPILVVVATAVPVATPVESAAATEPAPAKLPKTASELPLVGLLGVLFCGVSLTITAIRKLAA